MTLKASWCQRKRPLAHQFKKSGNMHHFFRLAYGSLALLLSANTLAGQTPVQVTLSLQGNRGFIVRYDFPTPITQFRFKQPLLKARVDTWRLNNPDLVLDAGGLQSKTQRAFDQVSIEIPIQQTSRLRQYDTTMPFSSGGAAVLSEHLALAPETWSTSFRFNTDAVVRGRNLQAGASWRDELTTGTIQGAYLYLGPLRAEQDASASFLFDQVTPEWIKQEVIETVRAVTKAYRIKFGFSKVLVKPALILSMQPAVGLHESYRGDSLPGQSLRLALYGKQWSVRTENRQRQLRRFLAHELAHVFNAELSRSRNFGQAWIHEGIAEYAALSILSELQLVSPQFALDTMNSSINACQIGLQSRSLLDIQPSSAEQGLLYDCGMVLFYTYDKLVRHGTNGKQNFFSAMRTAFKNPQYSGVSLLALIDSPYPMPAFRFVGTLMTQGRLEPTDKLGSIFSSLGIRLQPASLPYDNAAYLKPLADYIIRQDCKAGAGYWTLSDGVKVDGRFDCAAFAGSPTLTHVEKQALLSNARDGMERVRQICKNPTASFSVQTSDGHDHNLPCGSTLQVLPESIHLDRL